MTPKTTKSARVLMVALLLAAAPASPSQARGSELEPLALRVGLGSRVRIQMEGPPGHRISGTVRSMDASTLTIATSDGASVRAPRNQIHSLQLSVRRGRHTGRGAAIGAVSGLVFGAIVGAGSGGTEFAPETGALVSSIVFTPVGALVGAIVGYRARSDEWVDLPLMQSALTGSPAPARTLSFRVTPTLARSGPGTAFQLRLTW